MTANATAGGGAHSQSSAAASASTSGSHGAAGRDITLLHEWLGAARIARPHVQEVNFKHMFVHVTSDDVPYGLLRIFRTIHWNQNLEHVHSSCSGARIRDGRGLGRKIHNVRIGVLTHVAAIDQHSGAENTTDDHCIHCQ